METYKADYSNGIVTVGTGSIDSATGNIWWDNTTPNPLYNYLEFKNEKEKEDMMYLWEVILVNPKDDAFEAFEVTAKSETSALMEAYGLSQVENSDINGIEFDDLVSQCNVEMEWVKEKSLTKAIKTIQEAVK